jgi:FkbM family methyltransferase
MKRELVRFIRSRKLQPLWEKLLRISTIGMNYWGGSSIYDSGELAVLRYVKNNLSNTKQPIVFDIGANVGQYLKYAIEVIPTAFIYSFEPSETALLRLNENIEEWKVSDKVKVERFGFSDSIKDQNLYSMGERASTASMYEVENILTEDREAIVETIKLNTIDLYCQENKIESIDFIKIDIEGHELFALKGARRMIEKGAIRFIQFEFGDCNIYSRTYLKDFFDLLSEHYYISRVVPGGLRRIPSYNSSLEIFNTTNYFCELKNS